MIAIAGNKSDLEDKRVRGSDTPNCVVVVMESICRRSRQRKQKRMRTKLAHCLSRPVLKRTPMYRICLSASVNSFRQLPRKPMRFPRFWILTGVYNKKIDAVRSSCVRKPYASDTVKQNSKMQRLLCITSSMLLSCIGPRTRGQTDCKRLDGC